LSPLNTPLHHYDPPLSDAWALLTSLLLLAHRVVTLHTGAGVDSRATHTMRLEHSQASPVRKDRPPSALTSSEKISTLPNRFAYAHLSDGSDPSRRTRYSRPRDQQAREALGNLQKAELHLIRVFWMDWLGSRVLLSPSSTLYQRSVSSRVECRTHYRKIPSEHHCRQAPCLGNIDARAKL
jgi:hypothetical protein